MENESCSATPPPPQPWKPESWLLGWSLREGGVLSLQCSRPLLSLFVAYATGYFVASVPQLFSEPATLRFVSSVSPFLQHRWSLADVGRQKTERDDSQSSGDCVCEARGFHLVAIQSRRNSAESPSFGHVTTSKLGQYGVFCQILRWRNTLLYPHVGGRRLPLPACNMEANSRMHASLHRTRHVPTLKMASHGFG